MEQVMELDIDNVNEIENKAIANEFNNVNTVSDTKYNHKDILQ